MKIPARLGTGNSGFCRRSSKCDRSGLSWQTHLRDRHRAEYTSSFLEKNLEAPVTAEDIEKIATSVHGLYKNVDHKVYRVYLNKADILPDSSPAEHIVEDLAKQGTIAAYGSLREAEKL